MGKQGANISVGIRENIIRIERPGTALGLIIRITPNIQDAPPHRLAARDIITRIF